ncbi:hypothetical protein ACHAXM_003633 [Skeletonema potamos]
MHVQNANTNALGTSPHAEGEGAVGNKNSPLTLSSDEQKKSKEIRKTRMSKLFRSKVKVAPLSIDSSMNRSTRERLPAVTVVPSINGASPQAEITIEEVPVDETPPLPLTFQEQPQEDHKEKLLLRDRGRGMKSIDVHEDSLEERSMRYAEEEDECSDLPNDTESRSLPKFYAVEAKLVDESSVSSDVPIYDAVLVVPCWKRPTVISAIVTMLLLAVIAIIAWAASRPQPPRPLPPVPLSCSATSLGTWYNEDCNEFCEHNILVNKDLAIAIAIRANLSARSDDIQILSLSADGGTRHSQSLASRAPTGNIQDMDLSNNTIAAGIPYGGDNLTGIVTMFERNSSSGEWNRTIQVTPDNIDKNVLFGMSISVDGSIMAVGATNDEETGSVFIYRKVAEAWVQVAKLFGEQYTEDFGSSVIVKGNLVVVSDHARTDPSSGVKAGAVFLYQFDPVTNSLKLEETLINKDCDGDFGLSVALQDEDDIGLFVGCPRDDIETGAVYYYTLNTSGTSYETVLKQKIRASTPEPLRSFGANVAFDGKYLAVGAHRDESSLHEKVHIFIEWDNLWREILVIDSPQGTNYFGYSIDMYNDNIMISSSENIHSYKLTCVDV